MKALWIKFFQTFIYVLIFNLNTLSQTFKWHQKNSFPGNKRWGAFSFEIGGFGYVGGGYLNGVNLNDVWKYDPSTDSWSQVSNCPLPTRASGSFTLNNFGYYVGGIIQSGAISNQLFQYDPSTNTWATKAPYPTSGIYGGISFAINNKGYYGVGNSGSALGPYLTAFFQYDPLTNQWTQKASFPGPARYGSYGIASNNFGYAGFGTNENTSTQFNDWWQYNPSTNHWQQKLNYPGVARTYPAGFYINGKIFLGTGQTFSSVVDDFNSYDEATNSWNGEPSYTPGGRWVTSSFAINNKGYFSCGAAFGGIQYYNDLWEFSQDSLNQDSLICITLKPDSIAGKDIHILSGYPNFNNDPFSEFLVVTWTCGGIPCTDRELIQFDLSVIPTNASLLSAKMNLYANPTPFTMPVANSGNNNACYIQRIINAWDEKTVTWNTQPNVTTIHQVVLPQSSSASQDYTNIDVTQLVQDMINDPTNSFGFMFRLINETHYNGHDFATSDYPDSTVWPSLTLCYKPSIKPDSNNTGFINVFPNPFSDGMQVEIKVVESSPVNIEIYNSIGQIIQRKNYNQSTGEWIINNFDLIGYNMISGGVYYVKVTTNQDAITTKLIKLK